MKYLSKHLQESYAALWAAHGSGTFNFREAISLLGKSEPRILNILSQLKRCGWLAVVARKDRQRIYTLVSPEDAVFAMGRLSGTEHIVERYRPFVLRACRLLAQELRERLHTIVLYGSVARGDPHVFSDVDLLVVAENIGKTVGERLETTHRLLAGAEEGRLALRQLGVFTKASIIPLEPREANRFMPLYLDIAHEGVILYDRDGAFEQVMLKIKHLLLKAGAKKHTVGRQRYWELDPKQPLVI